MPSNLGSALPSLSLQDCLSLAGLSSGCGFLRHRHPTQNTRGKAHILWAESRMSAWPQDSRRLPVPTEQLGSRTLSRVLNACWDHNGSPAGVWAPAALLGLSQGCVGAGLLGAQQLFVSPDGPGPRAPGLQERQRTEVPGILHSAHGKEKAALAG